VTVTRANFRDIIDRIATVPSLPEVVTQVCQLVNDPESSAKDIEALVIKDPAMAAKMLRMVNSVYYALPQPVENLGQAVAILGFKTIRSIALSISVINLFQQHTATFSMKAFWMKSSVCACLCRLVVEKAGGRDPELGFIIGLLKDIGKILLVENAPNEVRAIIAVAKEFGYSFRRATREVIDTDDAEIGGWLMEKWNLGAEIADTVRWQSDLDRVSDKKLGAMCCFADYTCALKKIRVSGDCDEPVLDPIVWTHLGLDKTALMKVLTVINDEVDNARALLQLARG
jgi:HD-like signal output (HDOD) protein